MPVTVGQCGYAIGRNHRDQRQLRTQGNTSTADAAAVLSAARTRLTHTHLSPQKVVERLHQCPAHRVIAVVLARARDPEPERHLSRQKAIGAGAIAWGWLPLLALTSSLGVFSVAYANTSARSGAAGVVCSSGLVYS